MGSTIAYASHSCMRALSRSAQENGTTFRLIRFRTGELAAVGCGSLTWNILGRPNIRFLSDASNLLIIEGTMPLPQSYRIGPNHLDGNCVSRVVGW